MWTSFSMWERNSYLKIWVANFSMQCTCVNSIATSYLDIKRCLQNVLLQCRTTSFLAIIRCLQESAARCMASWKKRFHTNYFPVSNEYRTGQCWSRSSRCNGRPSTFQCGPVSPVSLDYSSQLFCLSKYWGGTLCSENRLFLSSIGIFLREFRLE